MPIYEFICIDCNLILSFLARSFKEIRTPDCPKCGGKKMTRQISLVSRLIRRGHTQAKDETEDKGNDQGYAYDSIKEAKMEEAMRVLEKEMSGIDEDNPNPRQLGHLMRRMSEISGEPLPEEMIEVVKRLESGEDPEKIEEKLEGLFEDEGEGEGGYPSPSRDPGLYDF